MILRPRHLLSPWLGLAAGALGGGVLWATAPAAETWVWVAVGVAALAAAGTVAKAVRRAGWVGGLFSPAGVTGAVLFVLFVLRPAALVGKPSLAAPGLTVLGFSNADLVRATSIGVVGLSCLAVPLLAFIPGQQTTPPPRIAAGGARAAAALVAAAGIGTALWWRLFVHAGGFHALANDPAQLHLRQFGGVYGTFGLLLCLAGLLVGLAGYLSTRAPSMLVAATVAGVLGAAGSVLLASRGPLVAAVVAAFILVAERPSTRRLVVVALAGTLLAVALAYGRVVRENAQTAPLSKAAATAVRQSPLELLGGDQIEFDHLVGLVQLVPDRLPWLRGRSLAYVPAAFVPRSAWPGKPLPIDYRLSKQLYGPTARAGTPFTLPGELYWNFGAPGVVVGMFALGLLGGLGWRRIVLSPRPAMPLLAALLVGWTYFLLTRPLAAMVQTTVVAAVALLAALGCATVAQRGRLRPPPGEKAPDDEGA